MSKRGRVPSENNSEREDLEANGKDSEHVDSDEDNEHVEGEVEISRNSNLEGLATMIKDCFKVDLRDDGALTTASAAASTIDSFLDKLPELLERRNESEKAYADFEKQCKNILKVVRDVCYEACEKKKAAVQREKSDAVMNLLKEYTSLVNHAEQPSIKEQKQKKNKRKRGRQKKKRKHHHFAVQDNPVIHDDLAEDIGGDP